MSRRPVAPGFTILRWQFIATGVIFSAPIANSDRLDDWCGATRIGDSVAVRWVCGANDCTSRGQLIWCPCERGMRIQTLQMYRPGL